MIVALHSVNVEYHIYRCMYVEPPLPYWDKYHLILVMIVIYCAVEFWLASILLYFSMYIEQGCWPAVLPSYAVLAWIWYQCISGLMK